MSSAKPPLLLNEDWQKTQNTFQLYTQVVGKIALEKGAQVNHFWDVGLHLYPEGFTTSKLRAGDDDSVFFTLSFNVFEESLDITIFGIGKPLKKVSIALAFDSVAGFYDAVVETLKAEGITTDIWNRPVEIPGKVIDFPDDTKSEPLDLEQVRQFWYLIQWIDTCFTDVRVNYLGKHSPNVLWWGGLDFSTSSFSGQQAPPRDPSANPPNCGPHMNAEAYSKELSAVGYWPGGGKAGAFYSYTYPTHEGYGSQAVKPESGQWNGELGEFLLDFMDVYNSDDPYQTLIDFQVSTLEAAFKAGNWPQDQLLRKPFAS